MHDAAKPTRAQQREVTLLFADLRGFTKLAASLETIPLACELAAHVIDCLTDAVSRHGGYVVDYFGDGLLAMWNAPVDQPDHAELASRAALEMLETLPAVAGDWMPVIDAELRLGIGLHTGVVQVGNAGSTRRAKYGPRGTDVHIAARVQAASKALGQPLIATTATVQQLPKVFAANRICRGRLPGLLQPLDLYAIRRAAGEGRLSAAWKRYDNALRHFEQAQYEAAAETLATFDGKETAIPWQFLAEEVQRELGSQQRRRSTDKPTRCAGGVIVLNEK